MNARIAILAIAVGSPFVLSAGEVSRGDTAAEVRTSLGAPSGEVKIDDRRLLYYPRGEVELVGDVVTRLKLRTVGEQAELDERRAAAAAIAEEAIAVRRARLAAEGEALKAGKLADSNFMSAPASYQLAFWEEFARGYPDVPCVEEIAIARAKMSEEAEERRIRERESERIAELEMRLVESEARMAEARRFPQYPVGGGYGYVPRRSARELKPFTLTPIEYRFYDAPLPYATTPGMPAATPAIRGMPVGRATDTAPDCDAETDRGPTRERPLD